MIARVKQYKKFEKGQIEKFKREKTFYKKVKERHDKIFNFK